MEDKSLDFVEFQGRGGRLDEPVEFQQGRGEGREAVDPVQVGIEGEIELPVALERRDGPAVYFGRVIPGANHAFRAVSYGSVQPSGEMVGGGKEAGDIEGQPIALPVIVLQHPLRQVAAQFGRVILREKGTMIGVFETDALFMP